MDGADGKLGSSREEPAKVDDIREYLDRMWRAALDAFADAVEDSETGPTSEHDG